MAMPVDGIPERVSLFGISSLPAYHIEVFAAVSRVTEVNLFLLSPTSEYWADIVSAREKGLSQTGGAHPPHRRKSAAGLSRQTRQGLFRHDR